jgi:Domain of unknown function (DUF1971)
LAPGTWGLLHVHQGRLSCRLATDPPIAVVLTPEAMQALPPDVEHEVAPEGCVRFSIEYLSIDGPLEPDGGLAASPEGGDPACWAGQLCVECGALPGPSGFHQPGCAAARPAESPA